MDGIYIPGVSKEEFLNSISETVEKATKKALGNFNDDKLLTQEDASKYLNVTVSTLIKWSKEGKIERKRMGGRVYYKLSELLKS